MQIDLQRYDPFADAGEEPAAPQSSVPQEAKQSKSKSTTVDGYIHLRIQQRNGRKTLTTLQGLPKGTFSFPLCSARDHDFFSHEGSVCWKGSPRD